MDKRELVEALRIARERWEALLAEVGTAQMSEPGASGDWTPRDVIAHLTAWESRAVEWLEAAAAGARPRPAGWPTGMSEDDTNDWIYRANRGRPLEEITRESADMHRRLLELVQATPEADLQRPYDWLGGSTLFDAIPGNAYEHYSDHAATLRAWLDRQPARKEST